MANKESTAVNELIDLVQSGKPLDQEGGEDLLFSPPAPSHRPTKVNPPRMTSTIPPMRGAGEVAPLPRTRAPTGTSQHSTKGAPPPPVRVTTAPPTRQNTIPPIPSDPAQTMRDARATKPSLPPPTRTTPPPTSPVAAPFEARRPSAPIEAREVRKPVGTAEAVPFAAVPLVPQGRAIDRPGDQVYADQWFEASRAMDLADQDLLEDGTQSVPKKKKNTGALLKKLAAPMAILTVAGIMVAGFFAFDGDRAEHKKTKTAKNEAAPAAAKTDEAPTANAEQPTAAENPTAAAENPTATAENPATAKAEEPTAQAEQPTAPAAQADEPTAPAPVAEPKNEEPAKLAKAEPAPAPAVTKAEPATPAPAVALAPAKPEPAKVAPPSVTEPVAPVAKRGAPQLVDVRINSKPAGATVMLVDNGKTSFLGSTPLVASLDASRGYDLVLTLENHPTQMAHVDPSKTQRMDITLGRAAAQVKTTARTETPAPAAATAPLAKIETPKALPPMKSPAATTTERRHHRSSKTEAVAATSSDSKLSDPFATESKAAKHEKPAVAPAASGNGTLMVSSKPPCEIYVDGKATGLSTPQRALSLSAGAHKITLVNMGENIKKTVSVQITANETSKLIQDLMKK